MLEKEGTRRAVPLAGFSSPLRDRERDHSPDAASHFSPAKLHGHAATEGPTLPIASFVTLPIASFVMR
jgi:hypothetical protein